MTSKTLAFTVFVALGVSLPVVAQDLPTLQTITIDGKFQDWAPVLNNSLQYTRDEPGTQCPPGADLDCVIQTPGRDLLATAWTYDNEFIYLYVERYGSATDSMYYFFTMDLSPDLTGGVEWVSCDDRVFRVKYFGSNGKTESGIHFYKPAGVSACPFPNKSDPLNCNKPEGCLNSGGILVPYLNVDGFDLRGQLGVLLQSYPVANGGDVTPGPQQGLRFEARLRWSDLGVPPGTPIAWHAASKNVPNWSSDADDNLGGPGTGIGTLGYTDFDFGPDHQGASASPAIVSRGFLTHVTGTLPTVVNYRATSSLGLEIQFFEDTDGDGDARTGAQRLIAIDGNGDGDFNDALDSPPLTEDDLDLDGRPDSGTVLRPQDRFALSIQLIVPPSLSDLVDVTEIIATSSREPQVRRTATVTTQVGVFSIGPAQTAVGTPGDVVNSVFTVSNQSSEAATINLTAETRTESWTVLFFEDCNQNGDPQGCAQLVDTGSDGIVDTGPLAAGESITIIVQTLIPDDAGLIGDTEYTDVAGDVVGGGGTVGSVVTIAVADPLVAIPPAHNVSTNSTGRVFLPHRLVNGSSRPFQVAFTSIETGGDCDPEPLVRVWSDPDGDGSIADGTILWDGGPIQDSPVLAPNGGQISVVVAFTFSGVTDGCTQTHEVTATATTGPPHSVTLTETVTASQLAAFADPLYSQGTSTFAVCDTIYLRASGLTPETNNAYRLTILDGLVDTAQLSLLGTDIRGESRDSYTVSPNDRIGTWTIRLEDQPPGPDIIESIDLSVEGWGSVGQLSALVDDLSLTGTTGLPFRVELSNENNHATLHDTVIRYGVLNATQDRILGLDGTWQDFGGDLNVAFSGELGWFDVEAGTTQLLTTATDPVAFEGVGTYHLAVDWRASCGPVLAGPITDSFEVIDCVDNDGDGFGAGSACDSDCDDDPESCGFFCFPGAPVDGCDGYDNDCDEEVDEDPDTHWYLDADGDGYGDEDTVVVACVAPEGTSPWPGDCDDFDANANPGAPEQCANGRDDDCDGLIDEADVLDCPAACDDVDNDGYYAFDCGGLDCNDADREVHPGAGENCTDGIDNNCDELVDSDDPSCPADCADADADGYLDADCGGSDCHDQNDAVFPGAVEMCTNGIDDNCDGLIDGEDLSACPPDCADADADGYLDADCGGNDCDDDDFGTNPNAAENCTNAIDDDCDGMIDGADAECPQGCADADADGYKDAACGGTDCDDERNTVYPGQAEVCPVDSDLNCDGVVPECEDDTEGRTVAGGGCSGSGEPPLALSLVWLGLGLVFLQRRRRYLLARRVSALVFPRAP